MSLGGGVLSADRPRSTEGAPGATLGAARLAGHMSGRAGIAAGGMQSRARSSQPGRRDRKGGTMSILLLAILGAAAGYIATRMMGMQTDVPTTLFLGVFGSLVGFFGLRILMTAAHWASSLLAAVLGALLLIWLWRVLVERR